MKINRKMLGIFILVTLNLGLGFYLVANLADWKIDFLGINPSKKAESKRMQLTYPVSGISGPTIIIGPTGMTGVAFSVDLILVWEGILAEKSLVEIGASGCIYPDGQKTISGISIGFPGARPYSTFSNVPARFGLHLVESETYTMLTGVPEKLGNIEWVTKGEYYPFIHISFINGSNQIINYKDEIYRIYVSGIDVVQQEDYNRRNTAIALSTLGFGIINIPSYLVLIKDLKLEKDDKSIDKNLKSSKKKEKKSKTP